MGNEIVMEGKTGKKDEGSGRRTLDRVRQPNFMDVLVARLVAINAYNVVSDEGHENARWLSSTH